MKDSKPVVFALAALALLVLVVVGVWIFNSRGKDELAQQPVDKKPDAKRIDPGPKKGDKDTGRKVSADDPDAPPDRPLAVVASASKGGERETGAPSTSSARRSCADRPRARWKAAGRRSRWCPRAPAVCQRRK